MQFNALTIFLVSATLINGLLSSFIWKRWPAKGSIEFFILILAITEWSFMAIFESAARTVFYKELFAIISYIGITSIPVLFLIFACRYVNNDGWLTRRNIALLAILPAVTFIIASTNPMHRLLWKRIALGYSDLSGVYGTFSQGPWYWIHASYSYILLFIGIMVLLVSMLRYRHLYLLQGLLLESWIGYNHVS